MSETVTSQNIVGIIRLATAGKSKTIQNLNRLVWSRFYAVCDSIETNPTFRQMAFDYANTQKLSKKRLAKLRRFLRESSGESIPDPDLEDLAQQITIILQEQTQDTSFDVKSLLSLFRTFSLKFAEFYAHPDDAEDNSWGVKVMSKKRRKPGSSDEPWATSDEDESASEEEKRYINIIDLVCGKVDAYVNYLDARFRHVWTDTKKQKRIYDQEIATGRWGLYYELHSVFQGMYHNSSLLWVIEEINYDVANDMNNVIKSMDAYHLLFTNYKNF